MIAAILAALLAVPVSAADPAESALPGAYAEVLSRVPRASLRVVDACFERADDARADSLNLPKRFCLKKVGTSVPETDPSPFASEANGLVDEGQGPRPVHISGGLRTTRGWTINVDIFKFDAPKPVCGRLNSSFAAAYYDVDLEGQVLDGPVSVRGFLMDGSSLCRTEARAIDFLYRRLP